jgi:hypothetical protein
MTQELWLNTLERPWVRYLVVNDLSNLLAGIANQVMDGADKNDISDSLRESSKEIVFFIDIIKTAISEVMEDDVILQAKKAISSLKSFKRKIDVLSNFSDSMGNSLLKGLNYY